MSEPHFSTGAKREGVCAACGARVVLWESVGAYVGAPEWRAARHDSPCGLPCLGGSISAPVWRSGNWHKSKDRCPTCAPGSDPRGL